jgi:hypothetical protein
MFSKKNSMKRTIFIILTVIILLVTLKASIGDTVTSTNYNIDLYLGNGGEVSSSNYNVQIYIYDALGNSNTNENNITLGMFKNYCGDGYVDNNEECDGLNLNGKTCGDYGHIQGYIYCNNVCRINIDNCYTITGGGGSGSSGGSGGSSGNTTQCIEGNVIKTCFCGAMEVKNGYCFKNIWYPILNDEVINKTEQVVYNISNFEMMFTLNNQSYIIYNNINVSQIKLEQKILLDFNVIPLGKYVQDITFMCEGNLCLNSNVLFTTVTLGESKTITNRVIIFYDQLKSNTNYKMVLTGKGATESKELVVKINTIAGSYNEQVQSIFSKTIELFGLTVNKWIICCLLWLLLMLLGIFIKNDWLKLGWIILISIGLLYCLIYY